MIYRAVYRGISHCQTSRLNKLFYCIIIIALLLKEVNAAFHCLYLLTMQHTAGHCMFRRTHTLPIMWSFLLQLLLACMNHIYVVVQLLCRRREFRINMYDDVRNERQSIYVQPHIQHARVPKYAYIQIILYNNDEE